MLIAAGAAALLAVSVSAFTTAVTGTANASVGRGGCSPLPTTVLVLTPSTFFQPLQPMVSVSSFRSRMMKLSVTADVGVSAGAEVRLGWSVNGNAAVEGVFSSPANFANHTEYFETRTAWSSIPPGSNISAIRPEVRLVGPPGATATLIRSCFVVEVFDA